MWDEIEKLQEEASDLTHSASAPVIAALPAGLALAERTAAALRAYLADNGLEAWHIFYCNNLDIADLDWFLHEIDADASWQPLPASVSGGAPVAAFTFGKWGSKVWDCGVLHLIRHEIAFARWYWCDPDTLATRSLVMCAAPSKHRFIALREALLVSRRKHGATIWQMIYGGHDDAERVPRGADSHEMFLSDAVRQRIDAEVVKFFSPEVAGLYQSLGVPYRRGVLLYGPPGNGKTSLIRRIGAAVTDVPGLVLRPSAGFDSDDLVAVLKRWSDQAPAILVIEDLDWLLKEVNVSTFLNILDGIDTGSGGLLLIATTNHPEKLDPAINNRPGRFDVVMEIPNPDESLRSEFFASKLPELDQPPRARVVTIANGLSFSHLQEVLRLSGLLAIHAGRTTREANDVVRAAEMVRESSDAAEKGFPMKFEVPFGLVPRGGRNT